MDAHVFDYYLTLVQVQMVILGFVVAGIVTLMQILNTAVPRRDIKLLAHPIELIGYFVFLSMLIVVMGLATWATAFGHPTSILVEFFNDRLVAIFLLIFSFASLTWFVYLVYRTKRLLDPARYLVHYIESVPAETIRLYVIASALDTDTALHELRDPFQPIREYVKHNTKEQYDHGMAIGLKRFNGLFNKAFRSISPTSEDKKEFSYLAQYFADSMVDFFLVFHKATSEKRKFDVIQRLYEAGEEFLKVDDHTGMLIIIKALEEIGTLSRDEDEIVEVIERVQVLTNLYLEGHKDAPWSEIAEEFEEICLSMIRLAETYYLQHDGAMKSVTPISYFTGKIKNVSISLVDFLTAYKNLADLRSEAQPKLYFEAIEAMIEILFAQIKVIKDSGKSVIGLNSKHGILTSQLYDIYYNFALEAIEDNRPDLFALSFSNLRRVIKSADQFKLDDERATITKIIIELAMRAAATMGDAKIKEDGRTISAYTLETLKHATAEDIKAGLVATANNPVIDSDNSEVQKIRRILENK